MPSPASTVTFTMVTPLFFSTFEVTPQAFHRTTLAYAIANLKPIVPGRMCNESAHDRVRLQS